MKSSSELVIYHVAPKQQTLSVEFYSCTKIFLTVKLEID